MKLNAFLFLLVFFSACEKQDRIQDLKNLEIGIPLSECVSKLNLEIDSLNRIDEPPLICHGFSFELDDGGWDYFIVERTPLAPNGSNVYNEIKHKRIIGIAWKLGSDVGHKNIPPPRWKE